MIPIECQLDNRGILYLDNYPLKKRIYYGNREFDKSYFFEIDSTKEYIIKYHKEKLNKNDVLDMLLKFYNINGKNLNNIDFPIGYYRENDQIKGLIIPNYPYAISIKDAMILNNLNDYYNQFNNLKDNILKLLDDILQILESLYNHDIIYTDVNSGNFLIYHNEVKIIDFDPKYIFYKDNFYVQRMFFNYCMLYDLICKRYNINNENKVKKMIKKGW